MSARIRPETAAGAPSIRCLLRQAFTGWPGVADMVDAVRVSPLAEPDLALVAEEGDAVVGFVMLSRVAVVDAAGVHRAALTLSPLAVRPDRHRHGIGAALVRAALAAAKARADLPRAVLLEGDPAYYGRFGFTDARSDGVVVALPAWAPPDAGRGHRSDPSVPPPRGAVVYPPAFALIG